MKNLALVGSLAVFAGISLWILAPRWDLYALGYLGISTALGLAQAGVAARFSDPEVRRIFYAQHLDTQWDRWVAVLGAGELAVYADYARLHLTPWIELRAAQSAGLVLLAAAFLWLAWVDRYLVANFGPKYRAHELLTGGPYRLTRHPRYAGLVATRLSLPLMLPGVFSIAIAAGWVILIHRRIRLEETHLTREFGPIYTTYASRTPGLI